MEAPTPVKPALAGLLVVLSLPVANAQAAQYRTENFVVNAPTAEIARQVAETAERSRKELAVEWLGRELPKWYRRCPVKVQVGQMGAGGATTFTFDRGEVAGWNMRVQGTLERVLDSVIPHEVSHTIFASHFRRPLPRWADEGAATLIEHASERKRQEVMLERVINTSKRIPLQRLLAMKEYPSDMQQVYTLYAEGYSLANFLVQQHGSQGKAVFLQFIQDAHKYGWQKAIAKHYEFEGIAALEQEWTGWVLAGSPARRRPEGEALAAADPQRPATPQAAGTSVRAQDASIAANTTTGTETAVALAPLARPSRTLRTPRVGSRLTAPSPASRHNGEPQPYVRGQSPTDSGSGALSGSRVAPRVSPFPGNDPAAARRMQQVRAATLESSRRAEQISTARTHDPNADPAAQDSAPDRRHWSEFIGFPGRSGSDDNNSNGPNRRVPFGR